MVEKLILSLKVLFLIGTAFFLFQLFTPKNYSIPPFNIRQETQYWNLKTGSKIGYFKVNSKKKVQKSPIIYLHRGPGGMVKDEMIEFLNPLSKEGHDLYFYDQIGSGHSVRLDNIEEYSVKRHTADLAEIINKISSKKVIIVAHSWGCLLAIKYLEEHFDKIEKIILSGAGPMLPINWELVHLPFPDSLHLRNPPFSNKEGNKKASNLRIKLIKNCAYILGKKLASDAEMDD